MNILITGAQSLLGKALISALEGRTTVCAVDADSGDLRDPAFAESLLEGTETIIHLAPMYTQSCKRYSFVLFLASAFFILRL